MITDPLRRELLDLLDGQGMPPRGDDRAHISFEEAVDRFPDDAINRRAPNVDYTPWHLVEHIRLTQVDILEYVRDPDWVSPPWPAGFWPERDAQATPARMAESIAGFLADRAALRAMVADPAVDLTAPIPWTPGHNVLREIRIVADHNAFHTGEFAILRQVMATWPAGRDPE